MQVLLRDLGLVAHLVQASTVELERNLRFARAAS
jgi:hypothetical protein